MKRNFLKMRIIATIAGILLVTGITGFADTLPDVAPPAPQAAAASGEETGKNEPGTAREEVMIRLKVPFSSELFSSFPAAMVNDDKITLKDLQESVASVHEGMAEEKTAHGGKTFSAPLRRLINVKLVLQEARNIELDQLPDVKDAVDAFSLRLLRDMLLKPYLNEVKANEKEVDALYKAWSREWKFKTLVFKKEDEAKKFAAAVKSGKGFDELWEKAVKEGVAEKRDDEVYLKKDELGPDLYKHVTALKAGSISPVIPLVNGFLVLRVEDVKVGENPELREAARRDVLTAARAKALTDYKSALLKKHAKQNTKLIKRLDFEAAKPGMDKLLKDTRVIVAVKGEKPITVADLAQGLNEKFYHGVATAIKGKKLNSNKQPVLEDLMYKAVVRRAALDKGLDKTEEFRQKVEDYKNSILFGIFIEKVIKPDVKMTEEDLKAYYDEHIKEYTYPEMLQLDAIVFKTQEAAQSAIDKLRQGMDLKWLKTNADLQVAKDAPGLLKFGGELLSINSLPEGLGKILAGANAQEFRLYAAPEGYYYVLSIQQVMPSRPQPLDDVREKIAEAVYNTKLNKALDDWADKLREAADIKIFVDSVN